MTDAGPPPGGKGGKENIKAFGTETGRFGRDPGVSSCLPGLGICRPSRSTAWGDRSRPTRPGGEWHEIMAFSIPPGPQVGVSYKSSTG